MGLWRILNLKLNNILIGALFICFLITLYFVSYLPNTYISSKKNAEKLSRLGQVRDRELNPGHLSESNSKHRLCVIVPFRERFEELLEFVPYMNRYLEHKGIDHEIIIVNQVDSYRFNRASLINIGFLFATNSDPSTTFQRPCDYIAMHDVDLLPLNDDLSYDFPEKDTVFHVAAPGLHPKYNYPSFIGGILLVSAETYRLVDGMSNIYWGWGLEDDEFFVRLKSVPITVKRPSGITKGKTDTFRHSHTAKERPRDMAKCYDQHEKTRRRDRLTGLRNVNYTLDSISHLKIEEVPLIVLNVKLHCDTQISPWCECPTPKPISQPLKKQTKNLKKKKISK